MAITKRAFRGGVFGKLVGIGILFVCGFAFRVSGQQPAVSDRFYQAIRINDLARLRTLIAESGANVRDSAGLTPLIMATAFGTKDAVNILVAAGADVNAS